MISPYGYIWIDLYIDVTLRHSNEFFALFLFHSPLLFYIFIHFPFSLSLSQSIPPLFSLPLWPILPHTPSHYGTGLFPSLPLSIPFLLLYLLPSLPHPLRSFVLLWYHIHHSNLYISCMMMYDDDVWWCMMMMYDDVWFLWWGIIIWYWYWLVIVMWDILICMIMNT